MVLMALKFHFTTLHSELSPHNRRQRHMTMQKKEDKTLDLSPYAKRA